MAEAFIESKEQRPKCPKCEQENGPSAKFCEHCGSSLTKFNAHTLVRDDDAISTLQVQRLVGTILAAKYEVIGELGKGGGGTVYRGRRILIGDEVAIKVLHDKHFEQALFRERFRREAMAAAKIRHQNVVTIYEFSEGDGTAPAFPVMELVNGESLDKLLTRERHLEPERAVMLMREICSGSGAAHRVGVFHRDLKPSNLIVVSASSESKTEWVKIIDFGVARFKEVPVGDPVTEIGTVIGTPLYMSPEQCRGEPSDARSDVYSLGVILYEMIAGHTPFTASNNADLVAMHLNSTPAALQSDLGVAPELESVLLRALSKEPDKRQMDASVLSEELKNALIHQRELKIDAAHAGASDSSKAPQYEIVEKPQLDIPNAEQQEWPGANPPIESEGQAVHLDGAGASLNKRFIGIDLGTTNTTCGIAELSADGSITYRQLPIPQLQIDPSSEEVFWNNKLAILPSAVWLADGDNVFTGELCVEYADIISEQPGSKVVHGIKSELANRHWKLKHNQQQYRPADISAILLRTVWAAILAKNFPQIDGIIITIPSSFSSTMRRETLRAAKMADLPIEKVLLLDEPIAALFSEYGDTNAPFKNIQTEEPILVFDMGGGTVDVTVLKIRSADRMVDVLSTSRYNQVAGDDLDLEIAAYLWRRLSRVIGGSAPLLTRSLALTLLRAGEAVKLEVNKRIESFKNGNAKDLSAECRHGNDTLVASFDRMLNSKERLELSIPIADILDLVVPFISKDESERNYGRNIDTPIQQALDSARLARRDISQVYLVGGGAKFRPVYLELKSQFDNVSQATLDASFAVSAGAARFAAATHPDARVRWRVSETTSERTYLRRNGRTFLEVLPDKLPIPSQPTIPSRPLKGNDTIEMEEESRYLRLEFFQGAQFDDPQMRPVYTATLRFKRPLKKGTVIHSLVGCINKHKIYQFKIDLIEPDGWEVSDKVEFSADSDVEPAENPGPKYHLNGRASLVKAFQHEPLRTWLNTRVGASRVTFPPSSASASAQTAEPIESLFEDRNAILRAMNESWADAYIVDKYLPTRMRATLALLQKLKLTPGEAASRQPHLDLVELYKQYDVTVIRSLLDHSFLLTGAHTLAGKLGPVVDILTDDLAHHPERVEILLNDLNQHAYSAFDVVCKLVEIFLKAAENIQGIYDSILNSSEFVAPFKLTAARLLGDDLDAPARLLKLLKQQLGNGLGRDEFDGKARPIIAALSQTGAEGFDEALLAFNRGELGNAGSLVLGSFGEEFGRWAVQQEMLPARYVPALFQALLRIEDRMLLDDLVFRLLNKWYCDRQVAHRVKEERWRLQRAKIYKNLTQAKTRALVDDLDRGAPVHDSNLTREVQQAAIKRDHSYMRSLRGDEQLCNSISDVLVNSDDDEAAAFLIDFSTREKGNFQRHLVGRLLRRSSFKRMNVSRQRLILEWPMTKQLASISMLESILSECKAELHPFVNRMIFAKNQAARQ